MSVTKPIHPLSISEYLQGELHSEVRHEYLHGEIFAMVGASVLHNLIASHINNRLTQLLTDTACHVFQSDMKVRVEEAFYYPDIVVTCETLDPKSYFLSNPILILEVLSHSTEGRDRFEKRFAYQSINSVKEYILVTQDKFQIEVFRRCKNNWVCVSYEANDVVDFESIQYSASIEDFYQNVIHYVE